MTVAKMQYVRFGNTGLRVSRLALGCMSFGHSSLLPWVKDEEESIKLIEKAYEAGINFFDTADAYSNGESERILGKAIKKLDLPRSRIVIATKVFLPFSKTGFPEPNPENNPELVNCYGLSRKHIFDAVDASLERLGLDYIDLYQIHRVDRNTPFEETMEALNDLVRSGKVRYIGCSSCYAWEFQKMNNIAEQRGWTKFVSMQNCLNLIYREEEREMLPYCKDAGIAVIPWSPLARGLLTGKYRKAGCTDSDRTAGFFYIRPQTDDQVVDRILELAEKLGHTASQIALAWLLHKSEVTAPIVGISKEEHIYDHIGALNVKLSKDDIEYLEQAYVPRKLIPM